MANTEHTVTLSQTLMTETATCNRRRIPDPGNLRLRLRSISPMSSAKQTRCAHCGERIYLRLLGQQWRNVYALRDDTLHCPLEDELGYRLHQPAKS